MTKSTANNLNQQVQNTNPVSPLKSAPTDNKESAKSVENIKNPLYSKLPENINLTDPTSGSVNISTCAFYHILENTDLSPKEKLFYLLTDCLSAINADTKNNRSIALSAKSWALRMRCSYQQIFLLEKSLKEKDYFAIYKEHNPYSQHKRNVIVPIVPDEVFDKLKRATHRHKVKANQVYPVGFNKWSTKKMAQKYYIDQNKMYCSINYELLIYIISHKKLNDFQKLLWLALYIIGYKADLLNNTFITTIVHKELADQFCVTQKIIGKNIRILANEGFVIRKRFLVQQEEAMNSRQDKSVWYISVSLPEEHSFKFNLSSIEKIEESILANHKDQGGADICPQGADICPQGAQISNKIIETRKKDLTVNIDHVDGKDDNMKNLSIQSVSQMKVCNEFYSKPRELGEFYPMKSHDLDSLRMKSGTQYNDNAINELLLNLANRYKDDPRLFRSKFAFLEYMKIMLKNELRNAVDINNDGFRIKRNMSEEEIEDKKHNAYLVKVEDSRGNDQIERFRRKLAGTLPAKVAYELLKNMRSVKILRSKILVDNEVTTEPGNDANCNKTDCKDNDLNGKFNDSGQDNNSKMDEMNVIQKSSESFSEDNVKDYDESVTNEVNDSSKALNCDSSNRFTEIISNEHSCKVYLSKNIELCEIEKQIILDQAKCVFSPNKFGDDNVELESIADVEFVLVKQYKDDKDIPNDIVDDYTEPDEKTLPGIMRLCLMNRFGCRGDFMDKSWFSKYQWTDDKKNALLVIKFPTVFFASYFQSHFEGMFTDILNKINYRLKLIGPRGTRITGGPIYRGKSSDIAGEIDDKQCETDNVDNNSNQVSKEADQLAKTYNNSNGLGAINQTRVNDNDYTKPDDSTLSGAIRLHIMNNWGNNSHFIDKAWLNKYRWIDDKENSVLTIKFSSEFMYNHFTLNFKKHTLDVLNKRSYELKLSLLDDIYLN